MSIGVCFVCLGNICRSPTAEGVFRHLVQRNGLKDAFHIESAGTAAYHVGEPPDSRSAAAARERGVMLSGAAQRFEPSDFARFDWILAMDRTNMHDLLRRARTEDDHRRVHLFRSFDPNAPSDADVPDPYYGGPDGFANVVQMCFDGCEGLLAHIRSIRQI